MKLLFIIALIYSFGAQNCAEIFKYITPELIPKLLFQNDNQSISISSILKLRLVCKYLDKQIITIINNNISLLKEFRNSIDYKKPICFPEFLFLNRLPNLRTHFPFEISTFNYYLFGQNFSFCKTDEEYKALYTKQEQIVFEGLFLFDQESPTGSFTIDLGIKYGWFNHGIDRNASRECNFSQIGFLFFDDNFSPPSTFWNTPYDKNTINPVNVLISLSFNNFFEKALKNFVIKIPEFVKLDIINPILELEPSSMFFGQDYKAYFEDFTKPLLKKRLDDNYILSAIRKIKPPINHHKKHFKYYLIFIEKLNNNWKFIIFVPILLVYYTLRPYKNHIYHIYTSFKACFTNFIVS